MEVNNDTGPATVPSIPVRPGAFITPNSERRKDDKIEDQEQELLLGKQHLSPGRAARMALQAISRKLGRVDSASASADTATPTPGQEERISRELSRRGGRREDRHRPWDHGNEAVDPARRRTGSPSRMILTSSAGSRAVNTGTAAAAAAAAADRPSRKCRGDARTVHPSAAPRGLNPPTPRAPAVRRRTRGAGAAGNNVNVASLSIQPHSSSGATATANNRCKPTLETQRRRQLAPQPPPQAGTRPDLRKNVRTRSPAARYLLLSVVLIAIGLILRYFWRHLAGLAGAMLILAAARRWTGSTGSSAAAARAALLATSRQDSKKVSGKRTGGPREDSDIGGVSSELLASAKGGAVVGVGVEAVDGEGEEEAFFGPITVPPQYWKDGGPDCRFNVRGQNYMSDKKKVK